MQFTEAVVNLKFDEDPKYAAYVQLFESLCGPVAQRPIQLEAGTKVGQKRGREDIEEEALDIVRPAVMRTATVVVSGVHLTLLSRRDPAWRPVPSSQACLACRRCRTRVLMQLMAPRWHVQPCSCTCCLQGTSNPAIAPLPLLRGKVATALASALLSAVRGAEPEEEDPAGPARHAVDHGVQRPPSHEAAVPLQCGQHACGPARGEGKTLEKFRLLCMGSDSSRGTCACCGLVKARKGIAQKSPCLDCSRSRQGCLWMMGHSCSKSCSTAA